jgi:hypothetical protein
LVEECAIRPSPPPIISGYARRSALAIEARAREKQAGSPQTQRLSSKQAAGGCSSESACEQLHSAQCFPSAGRRQHATRMLPMRSRVADTLARPGKVRWDDRGRRDLALVAAANPYLLGAGCHRYVQIQPCGAHRPSLKDLFAFTLTLGARLISIPAARHSLTVFPGR